MFIDTDGIVVRETRYRDADKLLTVLTRHAGLQTITAKGACRKGNIYAASTQLLSYSQMNLFLYKGRSHFREAVLLDAFLPLRDDLERMTLGSYAAEAAAALTPEGAPCDELLDFLCLTLRRLCLKRQPPALMKAVFELGAMRFAGYGPDPSACAVCGETDITDPRLHLNQGQLHCAECKAHLPGGISMPLTSGGVEALRHITDKELSGIYSFTLGEPELSLLSHAAEAYMLTQLERGFGSLDFYKKLMLREAAPPTEI